MANQKQTIKSKVLDFVESMGSARYTDIIRFVVDHKHGEGTFDKAAGTDRTWKGNSRTVKCNPYRGHYSGAFRKPYRRWIDGKMVYPGYFLHDVGYGKLEKQEDGSYKTIR